MKNLKKFEDVSVDSISQLKEILPINIIVPVWKEGENFKHCLNSIFKKLSKIISKKYKIIYENLLN